MPFNTHPPEFSLCQFVGAFLDFLLAHPLALGLVLAGALLIVVELGLRIGHESGRRRTARREADARAALTVAQKQQDELIHTRMKSVVSISSRRDGGRVA